MEIRKKSKIQLIITVLIVVSLVACQNKKEEYQNENINNNLENNIENKNPEVESENEESGDFPANPKDVLGNKIDFSERLQFSTTNGVNYQVSKDGKELIDNSTQKKRSISGVTGMIKSFICEAETESKEDMLNFIALTDEGNLYVAHMENSTETTINFYKVEFSEKIIGIGVAKAGYEEFEYSILKAESGRLMKISCYYEDNKTNAYLNDYIPAKEREEYDIYMKLIGEYEFVEANKIENNKDENENLIFTEGTKIKLVNPIPHETIALSSIEKDGENLITFWWNVDTFEKSAIMYLTRTFENKEELMFNYQESLEDVTLKIIDSGYEIKFQKK